MAALGKRLTHETAALLGAAYAFGLVILMTAGLNAGPLASPSLVVVLACVALLAWLFARRALGREPGALASVRAPLFVVLAALVAFPLATYFDRRLLIDAASEPRVVRAVALAELALLGTYAVDLARGRDTAHARVRVGLFALLFVVGAVSVLHVSPHPVIDVWAVHTEGAKALLRGDNPYTAVHVEDSSWLHMPPVAFDYPALPCYASAVAYALGGDVRWGGVAALLATGLSLHALAWGASREGGEGEGGEGLPALAKDAPALLFWLSPKIFFILEQTWNDVYPLAFVTLALVAHARERRTLAAVLLGLALSAKQTMVWFVPLAVLLGFGVREWAWMLGTAAATLLPFAIWDFRALKYWLLDYFVTYPARPESLTPQNWLYKHYGHTPSSLPGFALAALTAALAWRKLPRTRAAFALAAATTFAMFYVWNRFMFVNYYFFVATLLSLAAATSLARDRDRARQREVSAATAPARGSSS